MNGPVNGDLRAAVVAVVADVLRMSPAEVSAAGSLFDLPGFDSVAVVAVLERLEDDMGMVVRPELIVPEAFETVATLTALLAAGVTGTERTGRRTR